MIDKKDKSKRVYLLRHGILSIVLTALFLGLAVSSAWALKVNVRAGLHERFNRLVFDWPFPVEYTSQVENNTVTITFSKPASADFSNVRHVKPPFIRGLTQVAENPGMTIRFKIPDDGQVQAFWSGNKVAFDILKNTSAPLTFDGERPSRKVTSSGSPSSKEDIKKHLASARKEAQKESASPSEPEKEAPKKDTPKKETVEEAAKKPVKVAQASPPPEQELQSASQKEKETRPAAAAEPVEKADNHEEMPESSEVETAEPDQQRASSEPKVDPDLARELGQTRIRFRPAQKTRMAAFKRGDYFWMVFDQVLSDVPPEIEGRYANEMADAVKYTLDNGTAYRFPLPNENLNIVPNRDNLTWDVTLSVEDKPGTEIQPEIDYIARPDDPFIVFRLGETPGKLLIEDPEIGDQLFVVTVFNDSIKHMKGRRYPEFKTVPSALGLVIKPLTETVTMETVGYGVRMTSHNQMLLSSQSDLLGRVSKDALPRNRRLFDLIGWQSGAREYFQRNRRLLEERIPDLKGVAKATGYIDLAKLYVANGLGAEASGLLRIARDILPDLEQSPDFRALRGAAFALFYRPDRALEDLNFGPLPSLAEAQLWKGLAYSEMGMWEEAVENFNVSHHIIQEYPTGLQPTLFLAKARSYLALGDVVMASQALEAIEEMEGMTKTERGAYRYLKGALLEQTGNVSAALKVLEPLLTSGDRYHAVQAEIALVDTLYKQGKITAKQAIERLERTRFTWRGDSLEIMILHRLGNMYINDQQYAAGLSVLREAATLSNRPDEQDAITLDMANTFSHLFVDEQADVLSPIRALSIFNEFRELLPVGDDGNVALKNLAERLIRVDLLSQASQLLEDLIRFRLKGLDAAEIGTRLAVVRLLNQDAKGALEALDQSSNDAITPELEKERLMLRARALSDLGKVDLALSLLKDQESQIARRLAVDINWRSGRWERAAALLEDIIDYELTHPVEGRVEDIKVQEKRIMDFVLKRGIALALIGQTEELQELEEDYSPLMKGSDLEPAFAVVVRPPQPGTLADLQTLQKRMAEIDLFRNFLTNYKTGADNIMQASDGVLEAEEVQEEG